MTDWKLVEGAKPQEIDTTSSAYTVYLRRNIQVKKDKETGEHNYISSYHELIDLKELFELFSYDKFAKIRLLAIKVAKK